MSVTLYEYTCQFCKLRFKTPRKTAKACSKSCAAKLGKGRTGRRPTHGGTVNETLHPIYKIWNGIKSRCLNAHHIGYKSYGGRGIGICESWRYDYAAFRDWAISSGYNEGLQIDRIDNDKGYCPENCRWVTPKQNCANRRCSIVWNGLTTQDAANNLGMSQRSIRDRVKILGIPVHLAMTLPKTPNGYLRKTSSITNLWKEYEK